MHVINGNNAYAIILAEDEWYSATEQQQQAWINQCIREAQEAKRQYASLMVDPDAVMSISPKTGRHCVWRHTFATREDEAFRDALLSAGAHSKLSREQKIAIARQVFDI